MLQKYIVAEVINRKKDYKFHETILNYDKNSSSLLLNDDYVKKDINNNMYHIYSIFESIINSGIYSSMSSILRAIRNGILEANLVIIYTTDLKQISIDNGWYIMKDSKSLKEMLKYMTSVQYSYSFKTKIISRFELYGDPILGDNIERSIHNLINDLEKNDIILLDNDKIVKTYGLSRELEECYINGKIVTTNMRYWELYINAPLIKNNIPYFQLYDGIRINSTISSHATKCARISMVSPEYIYCSDCSKEQWILNNKEKEILCNGLTNDIWEDLKNQYCNSLIFTDNNTINKIKALPIPDYHLL